MPSLTRARICSRVRLDQFAPIHPRSTSCIVETTISKFSLAPTTERALPSAVLQRRELRTASGPGNALVLRAQFEHACEVITALGRIDLSSEDVAQQAASEFKRHFAHGAPVGEHLADQLLLPLWLAGGGAFVTCRPSTHLETNIAVMRAFGGVEIELAPDASDPQRRWRAALQRDA